MTDYYYDDDNDAWGYEAEAQNDTLALPDSPCPNCGAQLCYSFVTHCEQCFECGYLPDGWDYDPDVDDWSEQP